MRWLLLVVLGSMAASDALACSSAAHRKFDFWVGSWKVSSNGKTAGHNRVERVANGCALREHWRSSSGFTGTSLTFLDARRGVWHQTWIGSDGEPLYLEGKFVGAVLQLEGSRLGAGSLPTTIERITWNPLPNGRVRQSWERREGDASWTVVFDGIYERNPVL
jgi:hypothetical protein